MTIHPLNAPTQGVPFSVGGKMFGQLLVPWSGWICCWGVFILSPVQNLISNSLFCSNIFTWCHRLGYCQQQPYCYVKAWNNYLYAQHKPVLLFFFFSSHIPGVMQWMHSVWMWFTPVSRFDPRWPTSPAPAFSMSSVQTSGWQQSPSRMSMLPWCLSSFTRCATSWRPTLARSARKTSRTTLCSSTSC